MKIAITISRLGVGVLSCSEFLIPLRRIVNVKIIKCDVFDMVGVFVALAVVAAKAKNLVRLRNSNSQDDQKSS